MNLEITKLTPADMDQLMAIEREAFSLPWEESAFLMELEQTMPPREITATSAVPPPMSTTMLPTD